MTGDGVARFLFPELDIRGAFVRLGPAWQAMTEGRDYPAPVLRLLGEMTATAVLIAGNLKQPGRLTFQLSGRGPVNLLVIDCTDDLGLRGMARFTAPVPEADARTLLGDGLLQLSLELPGLAEPYRSLVPIDGTRIADLFEHYLAQSEQAPARLILCAGPRGVAGLFLQKLPDADARDPDGWARISRLAETARPDELLDLPLEDILRRLFAEEDKRLFAARPVRYHCPEDRAKVAATLRALGRQEAEAILAETGEIVFHDEICNRSYRFSAADVAALFSEHPPGLH